jgi:hypothetical protein
MNQSGGRTLQWEPLFSCESKVDCVCDAGIGACRHDTPVVFPWSGSRRGGGGLLFAPAAYGS